MSSIARKRDRGPFRAEQFRSGDLYELSHGNPIYCAPMGGSGSGPKAIGAWVVGWDPAVTEVGVDTGYSAAPDMLRAPDVAVGNVPDGVGWIPGAPSLAIEYADVGQDEEKLQEKIVDLLDSGTRFLWVVRLTNVRCVEVHQPGVPMRTAMPGELLTAPGVLKNAVPVEALYDRTAAERVTLINLLQRQGYDDLDAVLAAGYQRGLDAGVDAGVEQARKALRRVLESRGFAVHGSAGARIAACRDLVVLDIWLARALVATSADDVFPAEQA
jgi:hypothetical protein